MLYGNVDLFKYLLILVNYQRFYNLVDEENMHVRKNGGAGQKGGKSSEHRKHRGDNGPSSHREVDSHREREKFRDRDHREKKGFIDRNSHREEIFEKQHRRQSRSRSVERSRHDGSDTRDKIRNGSNSRERYRSRSDSRDRYRSRSDSRDRYRSRSDSRDRYRSRSDSRDRYRSRSDSRDRYRSRSDSRDMYRGRSKSIDKSHRKRVAYESRSFTSSEEREMKYSKKEREHSDRNDRYVNVKGLKDFRKGSVYSSESDSSDCKINPRSHERDGRESRNRKDGENGRKSKNSHKDRGRKKSKEIHKEGKTHSRNYGKEKRKGRKNSSSSSS